jgi:hypothetical protein
VVGATWTAIAPPTGTHREEYENAARDFTKVLAELRRVVETDLRAIEERAETAGAPWTPGRLPRWRP